MPFVTLHKLNQNGLEIAWLPSEHKRSSLGGEAMQTPRMIGLPLDIFALDSMASTDKLIFKVGTPFQGPVRCDVVYDHSHRSATDTRLRYGPIIVPAVHISKTRDRSNPHIIETGTMGESTRAMLCAEPRVGHIDVHVDMCAHGKGIKGFCFRFVRLLV